jgi:hypothetical protein
MKLGCRVMMQIWPAEQIDDLIERIGFMLSLMLLIISDRNVDLSISD